MRLWKSAREESTNVSNFMRDQHVDRGKRYLHARACISGCLPAFPRDAVIIVAEQDDVTRYSDRVNISAGNRFENTHLLIVTALRFFQSSTEEATSIKWARRNTA
ncbi:hypothetical protein KIN20_021202 [Parelaphostrongylus tenuis]|uniref:Uncharacterized protein n=1 Tax=Parelaphostrongylus tenuis TaxID=148309 RepID=A0AAD5MNV7_PARTN|nr:hypothetical protein KIN20_021202 [Parelaphostrongylus tenuis]